MTKQIRKFVCFPFILISSLIVYISCLLFIDRNHFYAKLASKELISEYWNPAKSNLK